MSSVELEHVWKLFGDAPVVRDLSLQAKDGEFLVLVGASGCGKSTTLRMLAGLETPTYGAIRIDVDDVTLVPPGRRNVAMVFQSYALYPHMTVYKNLAFGPRSRKEPKPETDRRIRDAARTLGLDKLLDRTPSELSGGQRQRVALGRLMIRSPRLSLLDEPLSNLDAALRVQMRAELVRLQQELKVTTVYVTHDQVEAMTMGERIAVMDGGVLLQVDTPAKLYDEPATKFVAAFIGSPKMNFLSGQLEMTGSTSVMCGTFSVPIDVNTAELSPPSGDGNVTVGIRPHDLHHAAEAPSRCTVTFDATVGIVEMTGAEAFVTAQPIGCDDTLTVRVPRAVTVTAGDRISVALDPRDLHLFDAESGQRVIRWHSRDRRPVPATADSGKAVV